MKKIRLYPVLLLILAACASPTQTQSAADSAQQEAPPTETASALEAVPATDTPAPFEDDTPLPPTLDAPLLASPTITSVHMLGELKGWAISEDAVLRTTDGGINWYNVSPPGEITFGYGTANTFLNDSQAWVIVPDANDPVGSGLLYRTQDGGLTWTVSAVPFGGGNLAFTDENNGWMMAYLGIAAGSMAVSIYHTDDGGATWTQAYTNDPNLAAAGDSLPLGGIKSNLVALDGETAWVGGIIYAPETFYLYETSDGGQTWTETNMPPAPGMENTEVMIDAGPIFSSPSDAILPVRFTGETIRTGFYATHDAGRTWEFVSFMPGAGEVEFVSPSEGFFWTGEQFFFTEDGAQTWTSIHPNIAFGNSFIGMDFVNTRTGWVWTYDVDDEYGLFKTTDGGSTWFSMEN